MSFQGVLGNGSIGDIRVIKTDGGAHPPDVWAELALLKILGISEGAPEPIRLQAQQFKGQIKGVLTYYFREAMRNAEEAAVGRLI